MNTVFLLMAQYNAQAVIPVATVVKDYFPHLTAEKFVRKVSIGDINIPLMRIEPRSQKAAKGVHVNDLAEYLDARRAAAVKEANQLNSR
jgi:Pyocin activator protein PrtN